MASCLPLASAAYRDYVSTSPATNTSAIATSMRRLLILRHAKSDWPSGLSDFDRPLAARGKVAAPMMGRYLRQEMLIPDLAIVPGGAVLGRTLRW